MQKRLMQFLFNNSFVFPNGNVAFLIESNGFNLPCRIKNIWFYANKYNYNYFILQYKNKPSVVLFSL